jgi:hypothetical protein
MILWMLVAATLVVAIPNSGNTADFVVYSVYKALDLGNPDEPPQKDFYVSMGAAQGVRDGTVLEVKRKLSTYDLINEKLYRDVNFPIARLKVIHVEPYAAIARLEKMLPPEKSGAISPRAVMVGDSVSIAEK